MKILSVAVLSHDSNLSFFDNGKLTNTILAERVSGIKHHANIWSFFTNLFEDKSKKFDLIPVSLFPGLDENEGNTCKIYNLPKKMKTIVYDDDHHFCHAFCGFYTSNFDDALCIVIDGNGSVFDAIESPSENFTYIPPFPPAEIETVFTFKDKKIDTLHHKKFFNTFFIEKNTRKNNEKRKDYKLTDTYSLTDKYGVGLYYNCITKELGFHPLDCGKVMGLAQYKNSKHKLPEEYSNEEWFRKVDIAYETQKITEKNILDLVKRCVEETGIKNVILTGGVFLNCVSNYNLVKEMPDINIHVDPICSDNGISIGRGLISHIEMTGEMPERIPNSYCGYCEDMDELKVLIRQSKLNYVENVTPSDIADIIIGGEIVSIFQGRSEVGQRSLGNRSLLFDPRVKDGKTIVNRIKKRENFRPFAASVLLEECKNWFNLRSLKESPTMSFAVDAYQNAIEKVPAVIHADDTCRVQTVTKEQNYHFYKLIEEFYNKTGVPMLLNTSFNLAGKPLVETFGDALGVMGNSELKYIYLPEINILIKKNQS